MNERVDAAGDLDAPFSTPAVAVSTVAFALHPPVDALVADAASGTVRPVRIPELFVDEETARAADAATLWIPLVRRTRPPFGGCWALPGGPIPWDETLVDTAMRTVHAAVRRNPGYLEQLYSFGSTERSADAQRLVTIAYWALYGERELAEPACERTQPQGPDPNVAWFSADRLPTLAFDHEEIVNYALMRLRLKTEYSAVAHRFLGRVFTLAQLRGVHEAIRGQAVDPANFRRQALAQGYLVDTGEAQTGARHRPARLYRFRSELEPDLVPS